MTKILLVEDDKSLREIYGVRLLAEGYDIISAGDGEEALAMAIKDRPALIVSDVMMPKISGFDMLDILRSTTETRDIKVIMMTALSSEDQRKRGESLGADRYLVKSQVGIEDVVRVVHEVLGDAPTAAATTAGATTFSSQPVAAATRPAPDNVPVAPRPEPQSAPAPAAQAPAPVAPQPTTVTAAPSPSAPTTPTVPPVAPQPFPQPTAPFSTPRPANLGDRIIHPLEKSEEATSALEDLSKRMEQELGQAAQPATAPVTNIELPSEPTPPSPLPASDQSTPTAPAPTLPEASPIPAAQPPLPQPNPDQPATIPPLPPLPTNTPNITTQPATDPGLSFEETPRDNSATTPQL